MHLRFLLLPALFACCHAGLAAADLPTAYDLRDVDGAQLVNTRVEDQVGPGPCWSFAAMVAAESSLLVHGHWTGAPNDLDLSQQWLRMNESHGYGGNHSWSTLNKLSEGFLRDVNTGGHWQVPLAHMARLHGPVSETPTTGSLADDLADGRPYRYEGALKDNDAYYETDGDTPLWPARGHYPAEYRLRQVLKWDDVQTQQTEIKQWIIDHGAVYVSFQHFYDGFTADDDDADGLGTYYDDGSLGGEPDSGLGGHAINFIGWDDSVTTAASSPGAWLVKQSHPVPTCPTYFWIAYDSDIGHAVGYLLAPRDEVEVFSHCYGSITGVGGPDYRPTGADPQAGACLYTVGDTDTTIAAIGFETVAATAYTVALYASLEDLENGADPLSAHSGTSDGEGFHIVDLPQPQTIAANSSFVVYMHTPDDDMPFIYYVDSPGMTSVMELTQAGEYYYRDSDDGQWKDLYHGFGGDQIWASSCAFALRAYTAGTTTPVATRSIALAAYDADGVLLDRDVVCNDNISLTPEIDGDFQVFDALDPTEPHTLRFLAPGESIGMLGPRVFRP
ncbi:MAG: lectin like domain-containing protein [Planctomycetota bacterium]